MTVNTPTERVFSLYDLEKFFNLSPDLLCIAGFDGYFKKVNPSVTSLLEYTPEELYNQPINHFVLEEDRERTAKARAALQQHEPLLHFENRYVTKSGKIVWLSWTSMPIEMDNVIFAIAKNITLKKNLEAERNNLLQSLTRINQNLEQLTYTTSHDLRAPVNNLISVFSILDLTKITDPETLMFINMLRSASMGLQQTLNNYVDALTKRVDVHTNVEEVNMHECLDSVLFSINALAKVTRTTFHIDFSLFHTIPFNRAYLESIFLNLITNSIKYAREGIPPVIEIYTQFNNGKKELVFKDNCMGFDVAFIQDRMFRKFQKLHTHHDSKGIGLYLVYSHITSMGGKISVESKINEGSTFYITFNDDNQ